MKKLIALLIFIFSANLFAEDLKNYKYKNYKTNSVEISFTSIIPKMRGEMYDGSNIDGLMYKPDGNGPFNAIVMLHGAGGIFPYQLEWADRLHQEGHVVLFADSYCKRKLLCDHDSSDNDPKRRKAVNQWNYDKIIIAHGKLITKNAKEGFNNAFKTF